jgi:aminoglycoside phosphotransferase (APT) family kinase protein
MSGSQISGHPEITLSLVADLVAQQFPHWAHLPIRTVKLGGWDNRTFHLGQDMSIRLPSAAAYAARVSSEQEWLPKLAPYLSCQIPTPLAMGVPSETYPWNWSIYRWIEGNNSDGLQESALPQFAVDSARFLNELYRIDASGGPVAGPDNFCRGASLDAYNAETRAALSGLKNVVDIDAVTDVWRQP